MESIPGNHIIESYWTMLKDLDADSKLVLIARLAQSLQSDNSAATGTAPFIHGSGAPITNSPNGQAGTADTEAFWWDSLEE